MAAAISLKMLKGPTGGRRKLIQHPLWASRTVFILSRYMAAILVAAETLLFGRLLGPGSYGRYALIVQAAGLLIFAGIGSASGYVYAYYKHPGEHDDNKYLAGAISQHIVIGLLGTAIVSVLDPSLALSGLLFLIYIPYFITEPMLRVRNRFTIAVIGKGLGSLVTLLLALVLIGWKSLFGQPTLDLKEGIWVMLLGNFCGYAIYYLSLGLKRELIIEPRQVIAGILKAKSWVYYWRRVLRQGIPDNLSSVIFLLFSFIDRLFIERYRSPETLSEYALGWQFSQGALLMLSSLNLISGIRIGESLSGDQMNLRGVLRRQLKFTALAGLLAFGGLVGGTMLLNITLFRDYKDLVLMTVLISMGYFAINVVGSVTSLLTYDRRNIQRIIAHIAILVVGLGGNFLAIRYNLWYGVPVLLSSLCLMVLSLWTLMYSYRIARRVRKRAYAS